MEVPAVVAQAGESASRLTLEFFVAKYANEHTRRAYFRAIFDFCAWLQARGVSLAALEPATIGAYYEERRRAPRPVSIRTLKGMASAIRNWLGFLTERGALPFNPALSVSTPRLVAREGKTPWLSHADMRKLLGSLDAQCAEGDLLALRDRALIGVMFHALTRIEAVLGMRVRDFEDHGEKAWLVLLEKGGEECRDYCDHTAKGYVRAYLAAAGLDSSSDAPLFQSGPGRRPALSGVALHQRNALAMVKRRCREAGISTAIGNHSFRATGATYYIQAGGDVVKLKDMMHHAFVNTTQQYVHAAEKPEASEYARIQA
jgi:site-specific recombinase XerD